MPGNLGRPLSEMVTIALMVVGASIGVFLAAGTQVVLGVILVALGAALGLLIGRLIAPVIDRSQTKRPPR
jgi:hypothetical protein